MISSKDIAYVDNEATWSSEESFGVYYFINIVDKAIFSIQNRFEQFQIYMKIILDFYLISINENH